MVYWACFCFFTIHISAGLAVKDISRPLQPPPPGVGLQASTANPFISSFLSFLSQWITPALLCSQFYSVIFTKKNPKKKPLCTLKIKQKACSGNQTKISVLCSAEAVLTHRYLSVNACNLYSIILYVTNISFNTAVNLEMQCSIFCHSFPVLTLSDSQNLPPGRGSGAAP